MITTQLNTGGTATVPASGTATVTIGPNGIERWNISNISVIATTATSEPTAKVYVDSIDPTHFIGGTFTGSNDSSDQTVVLLQGQKIICVWTLADVGARVTLSVYGTKTG
jgi:hypothetical protein